MLKIVLICIDTWLQDLVIIFKKILFLLIIFLYHVCMSLWKLINFIQNVLFYKKSFSFVFYFFSFPFETYFYAIS